MKGKEREKTKKKRENEENKKAKIPAILAEWQDLAVFRDVPMDLGPYVPGFSGIPGWPGIFFKRSATLTSRKIRVRTVPDPWARSGQPGNPAPREK